MRLYEPTDSVLPSDEIRAVEERAEVDSLGNLHARRRALLAQYNPLAVVHGSFGTWDARRKQMVSLATIRVRINSPEKLTEKVLDAMAHADDEYALFLDESEAAKVHFRELDNELTEITERIKSRETELHVYSAEARLAR